MADERLVKANGLEDAIIGVGSRMNMPDVLIYSYNKCVDILMEKEGWTHEEAIEWMDYNVINAHMGKGNPVCVFPKEDLAELAFEIRKEMLH